MYLSKHHSKLLVIACNTATVAGIDWYRTYMREIPIIGVVPVIKTAAQTSKTKKIIVLATDFTTKSSYQKELIKTFASDCKVTAIRAPQLVTEVERGEVNSSEIKQTVRNILGSKIAEGVDVIVLGSTHFTFLREVIRAIVGEGVAVLDSGGAVARQIKRVLEARSEIARKQKETHVFYTTGNPKRVSRVSTKLMGAPMTFVYAKL